MTRSDATIRKIADEYTAAWNSGSAEAVSTFYAEIGTIVINRGSPWEGRAGVAQMAAGFFADVPDLRLVCDGVRVAGSHVAYLWTFAGTHASSGRPVRVSGWEEWDLDADNKVTASLGWFDVDDYARQTSGDIHERGSVTSSEEGSVEHPYAELLRRGWAAYNRGDIDAFAACLTDDWREYGPEGEAGDFATLEDERSTMEAHRSAFPDKHTEFLQIVADDEMVACICTVSATHTGRYLDVEPTGRRLVVHEMMFNRVRDGRVATTWAMTAGPGFYEQLTGRQAPEGVDNLG